MTMSRWAAWRDPLEEDTKALTKYLNENETKTDKFEPDKIAVALGWDVEVKGDLFPDIGRVLTAMTEFIRLEDLRQEKLLKSFKYRFCVWLIGPIYLRIQALWERKRTTWYYKFFCMRP